MKSLLAILVLLFSFSVSAQFSQATRGSIHELTQADYRQILDELGIKSSEKRTGASCDVKDSNAENNFEEIESQYKLPGQLFFSYVSNRSRRDDSSSFLFLRLIHF